MIRGIALFFVAALSACSSPNKSAVETPTDIVSRDTFLLMLTEVQLIEGVYKQRLLRNDDEKVLLKSYYAELFQRFGISEDKFLSSYRWWYNRPLEMDELLQEAAEALTAMERVSVQEESDDRKR
jgi:hypothetical protein|tara:strand:- start:256 stop:630 length:375 start_codon:yes stop_codon:yes gene_type:complete